MRSRGSASIAYTGESRISGATITAVLDDYRDRVPRVVAALARMRALAEQMIDALACENVDELGRLVGEHWEHQRALHEKITTPAIDTTSRHRARARCARRQGTRRIRRGIRADHRAGGARG